MQEERFTHVRRENLHTLGVRTRMCKKREHTHVGSENSLVGSENPQMQGEKVWRGDRVRMKAGSPTNRATPCSQKITINML